MIDQLTARGQGTLPGLIGIEFISVAPVAAHLITARTLGGDHQSPTEPPYAELS